MSYWRYLVFGFILAVAPASVWSQKITKETIVSEDKKRSYYIYVPKSLTPASSAPLIVLLHGSNRVGLSLAEKWDKLADQEGAIIVAPDSLDSSVWSVPRDGPTFLYELVESIKSKYPINPRRVYLFGHSGGAVFALLMSLYEPDYFAASAVHAGALHSDSIPLNVQAKRKTPIQIQVGTLDPFFPVGAVRATRDQLNSRGFPVQLIEISLHNHWYYDLAPKINQTAWKFLKTHELPNEPRFEQYNVKGARGTSDKVTDHYNRGVKLQQAGDLKRAIDAYTRVIELDRKFSDAYNNRGAAYVSLKDYAAAVADFSRSIELTPTKAAYANRANIYLYQQKYEEAIADLTAGIKLQPSAEMYTDRGVAYQNSKRAALALDDFSRAIELDPKFARAYVLRGLMLLQTSRTMDAAAWKDLDKGFQLDLSLHDKFDPLLKVLRPDQ